ncbi:response regulator [Streptomyces cavernicola]|uniref:Response regulator transcription factor n=1 Tax=Streptomyces cavernicola TaxID=3043613 RepID=A0ABT6S381_9ACTN|nr:response regulator transcription factor [Streptomyces sp. B-S-A6]MDI3402554.1 response regulator transcription factor [Streptomyces sp. B-S-A6]
MTATQGPTEPGAGPEGRPAVRVVLADDQTLVRAGFRSILEDEADIEVVGEAADGEQALTLARRLLPDVVLMDIRMPGVDGLEATRRITADASLEGVRVVILTTFDVDDYVYGALRAGASGFLVKDTEPMELLHGVRVVARGDALIAPAVTRRLIAEFAGRSRQPDPSPRLNALTEREREVMGLVGAGLSNDEIAQRLVLSPATAKTHVSRIMTKLDVRDRAQLVILAYESGMITPGWLT